MVYYVQQARRIKDTRYANAMVHHKQTTVRKQWKVYDVKEHPRKQTMNNKNKVLLHVNDVVRSGDNQLASKQDPKPVDEDLYKIPPELLRTTKRVCHFFIVCCKLCYHDLFLIDTLMLCLT